MASTKTLTAARNLLVSIAQQGAKIEQSMVELAQLKGMSFDDFEGIRSDFVNAYCEARNVPTTDKAANAAARKGWSRILAGLGIKKPSSESAAATAKRAQRAAKGGTKPPAKGAEKAGAVKQELTAIEAHIVSLYRRGRFADILALIHSEAEKASPM